MTAPTTLVWRFTDTDDTPVLCDECALLATNMAAESMGYPLFTTMAEAALLLEALMSTQGMSANLESAPVGLCENCGRRAG